MSNQNYFIPESAEKTASGAGNAVLDLPENEHIDFKIIPNPNKGQFTLDLGSYSGIVMIEIIDISGKVKFSGQIDTNEPLNLLLETGVYIVRVQLDNQFLQRKLIIN